MIIRNFITATLIFFALIGRSQTVIWSEDFDGNGGAGTNWTSGGALNSTIGVQGISANLWYISDQEDGNAPGACGSAGSGDQSLHLSSSTLGDLGAAYDASALCLPGCFACDFIGFCSDVTTDVRSTSLDINTVGQTGLTLNFYYIELGESTNDDCIIEYSADGGGSWNTIVNTPKPALGGCAPQGLWTAYSIALPVACENITNLRIAFRWFNNADGAGSDPSFAVDDITITVPIILPVEWKSFTAEHAIDGVFLSWETASELNTKEFEVLRSSDGLDFEVIGKIDAAGNSSTVLSYNFFDNLYLDGRYFYKINQIDYDGKSSQTSVRSIYYKQLSDHVEIYPNPGNNYIRINISKDFKRPTILLLDTQGRLVKSTTVFDEESVIIDIHNIPNGMYYVFVEDSKLRKSIKLLINH